MKKTTSHLLSLLTLIAVALALPAVRADEKADAAAARKAKQEAAELAKYDANKDGQLDDAEKATMKTEKAKAKAERDAKKADAKKKE
jgi:hypothetical protein